MNVDKLLSQLDKVRQTGPDSWMACCPAHEDKSASLSIRRTDEKLLIHCFADCLLHDVVGAIGMDISDLFPPRESQGKPERRPFPAMDALHGIAFEALMVAVIGTEMLAGETFRADSRERLILAVERIQSALSAVMPQKRGAHHV
mgnify:CR=1 FL=1